MGEGVEQVAKSIKQLFPNLVSDGDFKVTSKEDTNYNCIAWAYCYSDRWMWPRTRLTDLLDGIAYWPTDGINSTDVNSFIEAFNLQGYEECNNWCHEDGFIKIALYTKPGTTECTHAARELKSGFWTSKLGKIQDIQHGSPLTIEGEIYGIATHFMKKKM